MNIKKTYIRHPTNNQFLIKITLPKGVRKSVASLHFLLQEIERDFPGYDNDRKFIFNSLLGEFGVELWNETVPDGYVEE